MKNALKVMILFLIFTLSTDAFAQSKTRAKVRKRTVRKVRSQRIYKPYLNIGARLHLGQETVNAERAGATEALPTQFSGAGIAGVYRQQLRQIRWIQNHTLEAYFGTMTAKGNDSILDEFRNQPWYSVSISPGISYRTTSITELGISIPLSYRYIAWKLNDPTLSLDKSSTFSYGLTLSYGANFGKRNMLIFAMTSHFQWEATIWTLGWNRRL